MYFKIKKQNLFSLVHFEQSGRIQSGRIVHIEFSRSATTLPWILFYLLYIRFITTSVSDTRAALYLPSRPTVVCCCNKGTMLLKFARLSKNDIEWYRKKPSVRLSEEYRREGDTRERNTKKNTHTHTHEFVRLRARNASHQLKRTRFDKVSENNGRVLGSSFWNRNRKGGNARKGAKTDEESGHGERENRTFGRSLWMCAHV